MPLDLEVFSAGLSDILERALTPLRDQIRHLKVEIEDVKDLATQLGPRGEAGPSGPAGPPGKDAEPITRELILDKLGFEPDTISEAVARHLEANPPAAGRDGALGEPGDKGERGDQGHPGPQGERGEAGPPGEAGPAGAQGERGQQGDRGEIGPDGALGHIGPAGERGLPGAPGEPGRDGRDGQIGRDGVDGKDGAPGISGKDGVNGVDGRDGLGFDDLSIIYDGERTFTLRCAQDERVKEQSFTVPIVLDRGVWRDGAYLRGDAVTHGGSIWIAKDDTSGMPSVSADWRLAVKRGRDGKAGANGKDGIIGPKGDRGDQGPRGFGG